MTKTALGFTKAGSFQVPALIADVGPEATKRCFEFFTVPIRNKNTRIAYYHAIGQLLDWCQRADFRGLEDIEPITVAAYIEQHPGSPATLAYTFVRIGAVVKPQGRGFLPDRKAINDPVPGERRQGDGNPGAPQTGGAS
jgi:hypothetical protein